MLRVSFSKYIQGYILICSEEAMKEVVKSHDSGKLRLRRAKVRCIRTLDLLDYFLTKNWQQWSVHSSYSIQPMQFLETFSDMSTFIDKQWLYAGAFPSFFLNWRANEKEGSQTLLENSMYALSPLMLVPLPNSIRIPTDSMGKKQNMSVLHEAMKIVALPFKKREVNGIPQGPENRPGGSSYHY